MRGDVGTYGSDSRPVSLYYSGFSMLLRCQKASTVDAVAEMRHYSA